METLLPLTEMQWSKTRGKVLVVDDSKVNQMFLHKYLDELYDMVFVSNGEKVVETAIQTKPDVILLDIVMEGIDGYEVCSRLKKNAETSSIPVIFVTGKGSDKDEEYGLEIGAIDYVTKPYSPPILKARLKNHIELKRYRDMLESLSFTDGLTGVYNRRWFNDRLRKEWEIDKISGKPLSIVLMDIDYFKKYNDTYGHLEGDDCLKKVATEIFNVVQGEGRIVARYGGEEFVCILPNTDIAAANLIGKKIEDSVRNLGIVHESSPEYKIITVSQGICTVIPSDRRSVSECIKQADIFLYQAKESGRNCFITGTLD